LRFVYQVLRRCAVEVVGAIGVGEVAPDPASIKRLESPDPSNPKTTEATPEAFDRSLMSDLDEVDLYGALMPDTSRNWPSFVPPNAEISRPRRVGFGDGCLSSSEVSAETRLRLRPDEIPTPGQCGCQAVRREMNLPLLRAMDGSHGRTDFHSTAHLRCPLVNCSRKEAVEQIR